MPRIIILFLPYVIGLLFSGSARISITWSLLGSVFVAVIAQTRWFTQSRDDIGLKMRLLRPGTMFQFYFIIFHVFGGAFHALNSAGYTFAGHVALPSEQDLELVAYAQRLMLLAHASVTAGMKLIGFHYGKLKYEHARLPAYAFIVLSLITLVLGNIMVRFPSLWNLGQRFLDISSIAIILEIGFSIQRRRFDNLMATLLLFSVNLVLQMLSGWKGLVLFSVITLAALIYPIMPRRVTWVSIAFVMFWVLYLHPFGKALRPMLWYEQMGTADAASLSWDQAVHMSLDDRLDNLWTMMVERDNELYQFKMYILFVPGKRPFYGFQIAEQSLIALVPRFLWPGKPDLEALSMQQAYDAEIASPYSTVSAKSSFYQDCYLSGGAPAMLIGCFILGMLIMSLSKACERYFGGYHIGTCLIFTSLLAKSINFPQNFIFFSGTIATSVAMIYGIFIVFRSNGWLVRIRPEMNAAEILPEDIKLYSR